MGSRGPTSRISDGGVWEIMWLLLNVTRDVMLGTFRYGRSEVKHRRMSIMWYQVG